MKKIFVSYTLRDQNINKKILVDFQGYLKAQGFDCYVDLLDNDYNEKGFQEKLVGILRECDAFLVLDSSEYLHSEWTKKELAVAEKLGLQILKMNSAEIKNIQANNKNCLKLFC